MAIYAFDGSLPGLLCCVFRAFQFKEWDNKIVDASSMQTGLFEPIVNIITSEAQATRVWQGLSKLVSPQTLRQLKYAYLSEQSAAFGHIYAFCMYVFQHRHIQGIEHNYGHPDVMAVAQWAKKVSREKHRMEAFVRFQKLADGLFIALVKPDFNVLPLIQHHFRERYQDQQWLIYDAQRQYGIHYDLHGVKTITMTCSHSQLSSHNGFSHSMDLDEQEWLYDQLWKDYFKSVNICERKNLTLHIQYVPKRYWHYLNEKSVL